MILFHVAHTPTVATPEEPMAARPLRCRRRSPRQTRCRLSMMGQADIKRSRRHATQSLSISPAAMPRRCFSAIHSPRPLLSRLELGRYRRHDDALMFPATFTICFCRIGRDDAAISALVSMPAAYISYRHFREDFDAPATPCHQVRPRFGRQSIFRRLGHYDSRRR